VHTFPLPVVVSVVRPGFGIAERTFSARLLISPIASQHFVLSFCFPQRPKVKRLRRGKLHLQAPQGQETRAEQFFQYISGAFVMRVFARMRGQQAERMSDFTDRSGHLRPAIRLSGVRFINVPLQGT